LVGLADEVDKQLQKRRIEEDEDYQQIVLNVDTG